MASLLLLHTCESDGTARANAEYLDRIGAAPHWVFDPRFPVDEAIRMLPDTATGKALRNLTGGVETNRREADGDPSVDVIQVELVGYADQVAGYDDAWYRNLRTFLLERCAELGVSYRFPLEFASSYGDAQRVRLTPEQWLDPALAGIVGHCHVPENDHWDPGPLDIARLAPPAPLVVAALTWKDPFMRFLVTEAGAIYVVWPTFTGLVKHHLDGSEWKPLQPVVEAELIHCTSADIAGIPDATAAAPTGSYGEAAIARAVVAEILARLAS